MYTHTQELKEGVLKSKILELQSALLFTDSASIVKLPTHVISQVEIDEKENIWFVIPRPAQHIGRGNAPSRCALVLSAPIWGL